MADLENAFLFLGQFSQYFRFARNQSDRFLHEYVLAGFQELFADGKMRLCGRNDDDAIYLPGQVLIVRCQPGVWNPELARRFEAFGVHFGDVQFHRHGIEVAEMVHTPAAQAREQDFRHLRLIQQPIPIIPLVRLVAEIGDQSLHVGHGHAESRACLRNDVLFDHDAPEIIGAALERHLADLLALCHPGTLDVSDIVEVNARQRLRAQIFVRPYGRGAQFRVLRLKGPADERREARGG